jgi:hypothetical protein
MRILLAALLAMSLAACATTTPSVAPTTTTTGSGQVRGTPAAPVITATPGLVARDRQKLAVDLLDDGHPEQARAELIALLAELPASVVARKLLDQIDRDPRALLGEKNYPYKVRAGETMSELAGRFLGDPLMFYGLARYNGIAAPSQMEVGQTLLIPGVPRKVAPAAAKPAGPDPAAQRNVARAAQLRAQGLEQMNRGAIHQAVATLRQAQQLDPANPAIQRDLDRALRIQTTVRGGR